MIHPRILFLGDPAAATRWVGLAKKLAKACYETKIVNKIYKLGDVTIRVNNFLPLSKGVGGVCKVWISVEKAGGIFICYPKSPDSDYGWDTVDNALRELPDPMVVGSHYSLVSQPGNGYNILDTGKMLITETKQGYGNQRAYLYTYKDGRYVKSSNHVCSWHHPSSGDLPGKVWGNLKDIRPQVVNNVLVYSVYSQYLSTNGVMFYFYAESAYVQMYSTYAGGLTITRNLLYNGAGTSVLAQFEDREIIFGVHAITDEVFIVVTVEHYLEDFLSATYLTYVNVRYKFWLVDTRNVPSKTVVSEVYEVKDYRNALVPHLMYDGGLLYRSPFRFSADGAKVATIATDFVAKLFPGKENQPFERTFIRTWNLSITHNVDDTYSITVSDYTDVGQKYTIAKKLTDTYIYEGHVPPSPPFTALVDSILGIYFEVYEMDDAGNLSNKGSRIPYGVNYRDNDLTICYAHYQCYCESAYHQDYIKNVSTASLEESWRSNGDVKVFLSFDEGNSIPIVDIYPSFWYRVANVNVFGIPYWSDLVNGHGNSSYGTGIIARSTGYLVSGNFESTTTEFEIIPGGSTERYFLGTPSYLDVSNRILFVKNQSRQLLYKSNVLYVADSNLYGHLDITTTHETRDITELYRLVGDSLVALYSSVTLNNPGNFSYIHPSNYPASYVYPAHRFLEIYNNSDYIYNEVFERGFSHADLPFWEVIGSPQQYGCIDNTSSVAIHNKNYLMCTEVHNTNYMDFKAVTVSNSLKFNTLLNDKFGTLTNLSIIPIGLVTPGG